MPRTPNLAALLTLCVAASGCGGSSESEVAVEVLARDLLADEAAFSTMLAHPAHPFAIETMCPSLDPSRDGADRLALVIPPPGIVEFTVGDEGPALLLGAVAPGYEVQRELDESFQEVTLKFELRVNGEAVFTHEEPVKREPRPEGYEWASWGDLELSRGDTVHLWTSCHVDGEPVVPEGRLQLAFGGLRLASRRAVEVGPATPEQPNLVLILQDTLRQDRLGAYGYDRGTSPNLDALAERGTQFDAAYATSSWTWPSTASVLTGMQPAQHGVLSEASCQLALDLDVLPEALQQAGYRTAGISGSRIILPSLGFDQGFERFDSFRGEFRKSDQLVPPALDWIEQHADERFFLYLHLVDTHAPHAPRAEDLAVMGGERPADWSDALFQEYTQRLGRGEGRDANGALDPSLVVPDAHREWLTDVYDASVRTGDHWLGEIVAKIEALGLTDRTVLAFTSDHGEELFDHGKLEHGHTLYGELVKVPLVVAGPGIAAGRRVAAPVSTRHLAPTLARLGGAEWSGAPDPLDLLGELPERPVLVSTEHGVWHDGGRRTQHGLRRGDWVLHWTPAVDGAWRLFDLSNDPEETRDVAPENAALAEELRTAIESTDRVLGELRTNPGRGADADVLNTLSEIGYLGDE